MLYLGLTMNLKKNVNQSPTKNRHSASILYSYRVIINKLICSKASDEGIQLFQNSDFALSTEINSLASQHCGATYLTQRSNLLFL